MWKKVVYYADLVMYSIVLYMLAAELCNAIYWLVMNEMPLDFLKALMCTAKVYIAFKFGCFYGDEHESLLKEEKSRELTEEGVG